MADSIFTKIIRGEIPCHKVYEDADVLAILTISPVKPGHTLVIPKVQIDHFSDMDDATTQKVMAVVQKVSHAIRKTYNPLRVALVVIGEGVPHVHVHVIPYYKSGDLGLLEDTALPMASSKELAAAAEQLKKGL